MKKILLICLILLFLLCGCGVSEQRREMEQLRIIQTVGVDYTPGGVKLSLAAASGQEQREPPPALTGSGPTFSAALERIRDSSVEEELFTGHVRGLLVGKRPRSTGWRICWARCAARPICGWTCPSTWCAAGRRKS